MSARTPTDYWDSQTFFHLRYVMFTTQLSCWQASYREPNVSPFTICNVYNSHVDKPPTDSQTFLHLPYVMFTTQLSCWQASYRWPNIPPFTICNVYNSHVDKPPTDSQTFLHLRYVMFTTQLSCWQASWLIPPLVCDISQKVPLTLTFGINYIYMLSWNRLILYSEVIWLCMSVKIREFGNARIINKYALFSIIDIIHIFF